MVGLEIGASGRVGGGLLGARDMVRVRVRVRVRVTLGSGFRGLGLGVGLGLGLGAELVVACASSAVSPRKPRRWSRPSTTPHVTTPMHAQDTLYSAMAWPTSCITPESVPG